MKKILTILRSLSFGICLIGISGCSDESQEKWEQAGKAVGDAAKETAHETKEGVKKAIKERKPTDPDTGLAK